MPKDQPLFDWTRYWCPRDRGYIRLDEDGYLLDPSGVLGAAMNPDLVTWDALAQKQCLVLLGEPGIGKTSAIRAWQASIEAAPPLGGRAHYWLDIAGFTENRLRRRLFEAPEIQAWRDGGDHLSIIVDSYDESGIDYLGAVLTDELETLPRDRLSLAIACRTLDWPAYFEKDLRRLWGEAAVGVYELAPLTYDDVVQAARVTFSERADDFLHEISRLSLGTLASKPFTLQFLLDAFSKEGRLPPSQVEVYEHGFRLLAAETSERRQDEGDTGTYTPDERLAIASRIAAVLAFANRNAVSTAVAATSVSDGDVTVADLADGTEPTRRGTVTVTEAGVRETLASGLFSGRGQQRVGFWHRTAEDFLAALYVRQRELDPDQVMALLVHPADPKGRIAPRLQSVAAWVAALVPALLPRIAAADPEVLIGSRIQIADPVRKAELVDVALRMFDSEELVFAILGPYYKLDRFSHPGLAEQLRPWITASGESEGRVAAFRFARECLVAELEPEMLRIALDSAEPDRIRFWALVVARAIASPEGRMRLRPLAFGEGGEDPRQTLKGLALQILFPKYLSLDEVLDAITTPRADSGAYETFLTEDLPENVRNEDLPKVLRWIAKEGRSVGAFAIRHTADKLMRRAWAFIDQDDFRDALAVAAWARLKRDERVFTRPFLDEGEGDPLDDAAGRRRLLAGIVPLLRDLNRDAFNLRYGNNGQPIRPEDVLWMVDQAVADTAHSAVWARLIAYAVDLSDATHTNAIVEAAERSSAIRERFAWALGALEVDSPEARELKAHHLRRERTARRHRRTRDRGFTPTAATIERRLQEAETGATQTSADAQPDAFWQLIYMLRFQPDGDGGVSDHVLEFQELPGWQAASPETRHRIIAAARSYVHERVPDDELNRPEIAGYMALRLLADEDPSWVAQLHPSVWERWLPSLIAVEFRLASGYERDLAVLTQAKAASPQRFAGAFVEVFQAEIDREGRGWGLEPFMDLLDNVIIGRISTWLNELRGRPGVYRELLRPLVQLGSRTAIEEALNNIPAPPPQEDEARFTAVASARALLAFAPEEGWPAIWKAIQSDGDFGAMIFSSSWDSPPEFKSIAGFPAQRLGELYVWLARRSNAAEYRRPAGEPSSQVERLEHRVLELLTAKSDKETLTALRLAAAELPNRGWLRRTIRRVEGQSLEQTWVAPAPHEVLALDGREHNRLIRNDAQLAKLVIESLGRLQKRLRRPNPPTFALWNQTSKGTWRPKEEERLSDLIADHLEIDLPRHGLIVNREVEIFAKQGGAPGEIPDLIVSTSVPGASADARGTASVVIEVKGCWHRKVLSAMETQLCERYLERADTVAGIYCVGWYVCEQWDKEDPDLKAVPAASLEELRTRLAEQARALSDDSRVVTSFVLDAALP